MRILICFALLFMLLVGCARDSGDSNDTNNSDTASEPASVIAVAGDEKRVAGKSDLSANISACLSGNDPSVDDPATDGWETEVFSKQATQKLTELFTDAIATQGEFSKDLLSPFAVENATAAALPPEIAGPTLERDDLVVWRWSSASKDAAAKDASPETSLGDSLRAVRTLCIDENNESQDPGKARKDLHVKVKIVRVNQSDSTTTALISIDNGSDGRNMQMIATANCKWQVDQGNRDSIQLRSISVSEYELVVSRRGRWFREYTPSLMAAVPRYEKQLVFDADHWAQRVEETLGANFLGYHGVTVGDANGDLLEDVYLCQPGGLPNLLLVQQPDGTLLDVSAQAGVDFLDSCRCALLLDMDNDGDQDLVVASITGTLLLENTGDAGQGGPPTFALRQRFRGPSLGYTLTAADYDLDGDIDVYACCYHPPADAEFGNPLPYHDANNGSPNYLLQNDGDWTFRDVTDEVGLDKNNRRWTYAACFADYDNDGDADLYVANDFGRNCLYRNDQGKFTDVAALAQVEDTASGMAVTWADVNHDGWLDVYVSNMFSSAGGRIAYQRKFKSDSSQDAKDKIKRLAKGNTLYLNQGDGSFRDASVTAGVEMGRWAWSSKFADLDNDGWDDLVVANGNYTGADTNDL